MSNIAANIAINLSTSEKLNFPDNSETAFRTSKTPRLWGNYRLHLLRCTHSYSYTRIQIGVPVPKESLKRRQFLTNTKGQIYYGCLISNHILRYCIIALPLRCVKLNL